MRTSQPKKTVKGGVGEVNKEDPSTASRAAKQASSITHIVRFPLKCISSTSDHQVLDPGGWGLLALDVLKDHNFGQS